MPNLDLNPYKKKAKNLKKIFEEHIDKIKDLKLPTGKSAKIRAPYYFETLSGMENFPEIFGYGDNQEVFDAFRIVIGADMETYRPIETICFSRTHHYLARVKETIKNVQNNNKKIFKNKDTSNIDELNRNFLSYTRKYSENEQCYHIERNNIGKLYVSFIDPELFTSLILYYSLKDDYADTGEKLFENIKSEICSGIENNHIDNRTIQDSSNIYWGLATILLSPDSPEIGKIVKNLEDFKILISNLIKGHKFYYPSDKELGHEITPEIQNIYRTKIYTLSNLIYIYNHFIELKPRKIHEVFLVDLLKYIDSLAKQTLKDSACKTQSNNLYYLSVQVEVIYKFLNMKRIGETQPKIIKKKILKTKRNNVESKTERFSDIEYQNQEDTTLELSVKNGNHYINIKDKQEQQLDLNPQQLNLLKEIIKKKKIHWIEGILIFPDWTKKKETPPNRKFVTQISRLNSKFVDKVGVKIAESVSMGRGGDGFYRLRENVKIIEKDIEKAEKLYEEAEKNKEQKEFSLALKKIKEAISVDSTVEAYVLLIEIYCLSNEKLSKELLGKAGTAFIDRIKILRPARTYIEKNLEKDSPPVIWTRKEVSNSYYEIGVEIELLEKQNERARKLLENIRPDLNKEEKFRLQIVDKINELRNGEFVSVQEKDKNFRDLISALETQNIFKKVARKVLEFPWARAETKTLIDTAKSFLWDFIEVSEERYINSPASVMNLEIGLIDYLVEKVLSVYAGDETNKRTSPNIDVAIAERLNCQKA